MNLKQNTLSSIRILVVEDDPIQRELLVGLLSDAKVGEVLIATNGSEGLSTWRTFSPTLVLTDVIMPDMDGLSMCRAIRAEDPDAEIVVVTHHSDIEYLRQAIDIGVDKYVLKPVDGKLLLAMVEGCLREHDQRMQLRLAKLAFMDSNEGMLVTDQETRILTVNPAVTTITGYRPDEIIGQRPSLFASGQHDDDFYRVLWDSLRVHGRWAGEIVNRRKDGTVFPEWLSISSVEGVSGEVCHYVGVISDITERKQEENQIRRMAHFDSLTGLPNRLMMTDYMQRALARARRQNRALSVLYIDLDNFKPINDTFGHDAGDEALRVMAERMLACIRKTDTAGRWGGDEFLIFLDESARTEGLVQVCENLVTSLSLPMVWHDKTLKLSASIGVATFPKDGEEPDALIRSADEAMYRAKVSGGGCYQFARVEAQSRIHSRIRMERDLREGLKAWSYSLHYLPEISFLTWEVSNVEALLRFHHPENGLLEAGQFLEIAESIGIMPELGQRALKEAALEMARLRDEGYPLGLTVDLSRRQLAVPDAAKSLLSALEQAGFRKEDVTFECAESSVTANENALSTLLSLAAQGCRFTLDDFGTGFCSFNLIGQLPISAIKIDRYFVTEIESNPQARQLVGALIAFARRMDMRVIAEGVETTAQLDFLYRQGCHAAQGYLFAKPMALEDLRVFLARKDWCSLVEGLLP
ncbi:MAG: EAL domain-containing protein [Rhodocyclaceae bacterium]|nr:EAL domain-containing protein [Rhodocyclaceae bacterium]